MNDNFKPIVICADDYGLSDGISEAIEALIACGRLSATGAMTGLAGWRRRAPMLKQLVREYPADIGLHFTLTGQRPLTSAPGLASDGRLPEIGPLILRALGGRLPLDVIREELRAQLDAFEDAWGAPPDFLDGHQHAHALPGIRRVVIEELATRYGGHPLWLRNCVEPLNAARQRGGLAKAMVVGGLSAGVAPRAAQAGIPTNDSFRGLYDFSDLVPYRSIFRAALNGPGTRALVHCHPGKVDAELRRLDPLLEPREREYAYLRSDQCAEDLSLAHIRPSRFRQTAAGA